MVADGCLTGAALRMGLSEQFAPVAALMDSVGVLGGIAIASTVAILMLMAAAYMARRVPGGVGALSAGGLVLAVAFRAGVVFWNIGMIGAVR